MGRGRAKAKQTKVARDLKYRAQETDLTALARELHGDEPPVDAVVDDTPDPKTLSAWSDYADTEPRARD